MTSRLLIAGSVAAGCIAAAGVGGFLAVRTATHSSQAASLPAAETSAAGSGLTASGTRQVADLTGPVSTPVSRRQDAGPTQAFDTSTRGSEGARPAPGEPAPIETDITTAPPPASVQPVNAPEAPISYADATPPALPRVMAVEIPSNAVIGVRLDTTVSSETANVEDTVRARVTRPVIVDGITVLPAGAQLVGSVTMVERGGKIRERSRVGIRFTSVVVDDVRVPIQTEAIYREGQAPAREATAKIGASAVVGSILGGVFGGKKGAVIGGAAGAAGGTAIVVAGDRNPAILASGSPLTLRLSEAAAFHVER